MNQRGLTTYSKWLKLYQIMYDNQNTDTIKVLRPWVDYVNSAKYSLTVTIKSNIDQFCVGLEMLLYMLTKNIYYITKLL